MNAQVVTALIAASVSLILAGYNTWNGRNQDKRVALLEERRAELENLAAAERARLDYEYDARRGIYERCGPAMFQIVELSEDALGCITALTDPETWLELAKGEVNPPGTLRATLPRERYEVLATIYGLYAPMVVVRQLSRKLSLTDLSLEPKIELQYHLASSIYRSFRDDQRLAAIDPTIAYSPFASEWRSRRETEPSQFWWQGLTLGRLEGMLDLMTVKPEGGDERVTSFGEFERFYQEIFLDQDEIRRKVVAAAANAIYCFRPKDRPVFWRMLIAQARLYQALARSRRNALTIPDSESAWLEYLRLEDQQEFSWRGSESGAPLAETLAVTDEYLRATVVAPWLSRKV